MVMLDQKTFYLVISERFFFGDVFIIGEFATRQDRVYNN